MEFPSARLGCAAACAGVCDANAVLAGGAMIEKLNALLALFSPDRPEWGASEVAQALQMPRSTTYRLLARISMSGYLDSDAATGRFRLGMRLAELGSLAQRSTPLQRAGNPVLRRLSSETDETATLMIRSGLTGIVVDIAEGSLPVSVPELPGARHPLYDSAAGKVLLAWMPEAERHALFRRGTGAQGTPALPDAQMLERELHVIRENGAAIVRVASRDLAFGAAAPVFARGNRLAGALQVGGASRTVTDERLAELAALVVTRAAQISAMLDRLANRDVSAHRESSHA